MAEAKINFNEENLFSPFNRMEGTVRVPSFRDLEATITVIKSDASNIDGVITITPKTYMVAEFDIPATSFVDAELTVVRYDNPSIEGELIIAEKREYSFIDAGLVVSIPVENYIDGSVIITPTVGMVAEIEIEPSHCFIEEILPTADFSVREDQPYINYGTQDELVIGSDSNTNFESYLRWNIDKIPKDAVLSSAKMYFNSTRLMSEGVRLYLCEASNLNTSSEGPSEWTETGTTWINKPEILDIVEEFFVPPAPSRIEIDLFNYISEWLLGDKSSDRSFTFLIASGNTSVTFGSRESTYYPPVLDIQYYLRPPNPGESVIDGELIVASHKDSYLPGEINVPAKQIRRTIDGFIEIVETSTSSYLDGFLTVKNHFSSSIEGELSISNKYADTSIAAEIYIRAFTWTELDAEFVIDPELLWEDLDSEIKVRVAANVYLEGILNIGKQELVEDIEGELYVSVSEDRKLFDFIPGSVELSKKNLSDSIDAEVSIRMRESSDIFGSLELTEKHEDYSIEGEVFPRIKDFDYLSSEILIEGKPAEQFLDASLTIKEIVYEEIIGEVFIRERDYISGSVDVILASMIDAEMDVKSPYLDGEILVSIRVQEFIEGILIPRIPAVDVLDGELYVSYPGYPFVHLISATRKILTPHPDFNSLEIKFYFDKAVDSFRINIGGTSYDTGKTILSHNGFIDMEEVITVTIRYEDLISTGSNRLNIYGKFGDGEWTAYEATSNK